MIPHFGRKSAPLLFILVLTAGMNLNLNAQRAQQRGYPPIIECDSIVVYKTIDTTQLKLWIFVPESRETGTDRPAIVFFFGGGWRSGTPAQFINHCKYLSARGVVAMVADYRVASRNNVLVNSCVSDAKSAIRWVRLNASELGVDPDRIAAGGGSAGGHLAASTATLPSFDEPSEDHRISSKPDALVLFNPVVIVAPVQDEPEAFAESFEKRKNRLGAEPEQISPYHHIVPGLPPTVIFHGTADTTVPFASVELFTSKMRQEGNVCILVGYRNMEHGFFNYGRDGNAAYISTIHRMDQFLVSLGYLSALPEIIEK